MSRMLGQANPRGAAALEAEASAAGKTPCADTAPLIKVRFCLDFVTLG